MHFDSRKLYLGLLFLLIGGFFAWTAWTSLEMGTPLRMGPGFFPFALSVILIGIAIVQFIPRRMAGSEPFSFGIIPWRGIILISICPILFGLTIRGAGLVPAVALLAFVPTFASKSVRLRFAILFTIGMTTFCVLLFGVGLKLPIEFFGTWFRF